MTAPRRNTRPAPAGDTKSQGPSLKELLGPEEPEETRNRTVRQEFERMHSEAEKKKRLEILDAFGFNQRYEEIMRDKPELTAEAWYEQTEQEHMQVDPRGKRKYSNFESFRQVRRRIIRGEMKQGEK